MAEEGTGISLEISTVLSLGGNLVNELETISEAFAGLETKSRNLQESIGGIGTAIETIGGAFNTAAEGATPLITAIESLTKIADVTGKEIGRLLGGSFTTALAGVKATFADIDVVSQDFATRMAQQWEQAAIRVRASIAGINGAIPPAPPPPPISPTGGNSPPPPPPPPRSPAASNIPYTRDERTMASYLNQSYDSAESLREEHAKAAQKAIDDAKDRRYAEAKDEDAAWNRAYDAKRQAAEEENRIRTRQGLLSGDPVYTDPVINRRLEDERISQTMARREEELRQQRGLPSRTRDVATGAVVGSQAARHFGHVDIGMGTIMEGIAIKNVLERISHASESVGTVLTNTHNANKISPTGAYDPEMERQIRDTAASASEGTFVSRSKTIDYIATLAKVARDENPDASNEEILQHVLAMTPAVVRTAEVAARIQGHGTEGEVKANIDALTMVSHLFGAWDAKKATPLYDEALKNAESADIDLPKFRTQLTREGVGLIHSALGRGPEVDKQIIRDTGFSYNFLGPQTAASISGFWGEILGAEKTKKTGRHSTENVKRLLSKHGALSHEDADDVIARMQRGELGDEDNPWVRLGLMDEQTMKFKPQFKDAKTGIFNEPAIAQQLAQDKANDPEYAKWELLAFKHQGAKEAEILADPNYQVLRTAHDKNIDSKLGGEAEQERMAQQPIGQWLIFQKNLADISDTIGNQVLPGLNDQLKRLNSGLTGFSHFLDNHKDLASGLAHGLEALIGVQLGNMLIKAFGGPSLWGLIGKGLKASYTLVTDAAMAEAAGGAAAVATGGSAAAGATAATAAGAGAGMAAGGTGAAVVTGGSTAAGGAAASTAASIVAPATAITGLGILGAIGAFFEGKKEASAGELGFQVSRMAGGEVPFATEYTKEGKTYSAIEVDDIVRKTNAERQTAAAAEAAKKTTVSQPPQSQNQTAAGGVAATPGQFDQTANLLNQAAKSLTDSANLLRDILQNRQGGSNASGVKPPERHSSIAGLPQLAMNDNGVMSDAGDGVSLSGMPEYQDHLPSPATQGLLTQLGMAPGQSPAVPTVASTFAANEQAQESGQRQIERFPSIMRLRPSYPVETTETGETEDGTPVSAAVNKPKASIMRLPKQPPPPGSDDAVSAYRHMNEKQLDDLITEHGNFSPLRSHHPEQHINHPPRGTVTPMQRVPTSSVLGGAANFANGTPRGSSRSGQASIPSAQQTARAKEAMQFFMSHGRTPEQAAGIVANIMQESGMREGAVGDGGQAIGIAQWHGDRIKALEAAGFKIKGATFQQQLAAMNYEMTEGGERRAGAMLSTTKTAAEAGAAISRYYERPANVAGEMQMRGAAAERGMHDWMPGSSRNSLMFQNAMPPPPAGPRVPNQMELTDPNSPDFGRFGYLTSNTMQPQEHTHNVNTYLDGDIVAQNTVKNIVRNANHANRGVSGFDSAMSPSMPGPVVRMN